MATFKGIKKIRETQGNLRSLRNDFLTQRVATLSMKLTNIFTPNCAQVLFNFNCFNLLTINSKQYFYILSKHLMQKHALQPSFYY